MVEKRAGRVAARTDDLTGATESLVTGAKRVMKDMMVMCWECVGD